MIGYMVRMTTHHRMFSISGLLRELGIERRAVINDFTMVAPSLPARTSADLSPIGSGIAVPGAPLAVLGAGTGLGVSGLLPAGRGVFAPIVGEGGHVTLAAGDDREAAVVQWLRHRFGDPLAERALSGPGLLNLFEAMCSLSGQAALPLQPVEVIARARGASGVGSDLVRVVPFELFCSFPRQYGRESGADPRCARRDLHRRWHRVPADGRDREVVFS